MIDTALIYPANKLSLAEHKSAKVPEYPESFIKYNEFSYHVRLFPSGGNLCLNYINAKFLWNQHSLYTVCSSLLFRCFINHKFMPCTFWTLSYHFYKILDEYLKGKTRSTQSRASDSTVSLEVFFPNGKKHNDEATLQLF